MSAGGGGGPEGHEVKLCGGEPLTATLERIEELLLFCSAGIRTSVIVTLQRLNTGRALPRL